MIEVSRLSYGCIRQTPQVNQPEKVSWRRWCLSVKEWIKKSQRKEEEGLSHQREQKAHRLGNGTPSSLVMLRCEGRGRGEEGERICWEPDLRATGWPGYQGQEHTKGLSIRIAGSPSWVKEEESPSIWCRCPRTKSSCCGKTRNQPHSPPPHANTPAVLDAMSQVAVH